MSRMNLRAMLVVLATSAFALTACQRVGGHAETMATTPATGSTKSETAPATTAPMTAAATTTNTAAPASSSALPGDNVSTPRYKIAIQYPDPPLQLPPLLQALHVAADAAKRDFMGALPDPAKFPEFANRQLQLLVDFELVATTPDFASVRETGMADTGGAHPLPIDATFVYDAAAQRMITLDDLFADPAQARAKLSEFTRTSLKKKIMARAPQPGEGSPEAIHEWRTNALQMIDEGTKPTIQDFTNFIVRAGTAKNATSAGITVVFPPYQVAPYVYGAQIVDVPPRVFSPYLKPQYRSAFARP